MGSRPSARAGPRWAGDAGSQRPRSASVGFITLHGPVQRLRGITAVEFLPTDGGQLSSHRATITPRSSLGGVPVRHGTDARSRRIAPGSSCRAGSERIHLSPFRGISIQQTRRKEWKVVLSPAVLESDALGCGAAAPGLCRQRRRAAPSTLAPSTPRGGRAAFPSSDLSALGCRAQLGVLQPAGCPACTEVYLPFNETQ